MAFWRSKHKPGMPELCKSTKELLLRITAEAPQQKLDEDIARNLGHMKVTLQGTPEAEISPPLVYQLVHLLLNDEILLPLAQNIHKLPFEARKDAQTIFCHCFRYKDPNSEEPPILSYVVNVQPDIIVALCHGYDHRESAMVCGNILREALKYDCMAALVLYDEPSHDGNASGLARVNPSLPVSGKGVLWSFFTWIHQTTFEVSADAFSTFRDILSKHRKLVAHFLLTNFTRFFAMYNEILINSSSYVTKRQSIKLLGELLLERVNFDIMTRYIQSPDNLKTMMMLLRDDRRMVNYEAFHIFKIFVANPNKHPAVLRILVQNRERLLRFLPAFLDDRSEDVQFTDEKAYLIRTIERLPSPVAKPPSPPHAGVAPLHLAADTAMSPGADGGGNASAGAGTALGAGAVVA